MASPRFLGARRRLLHAAAGGLAALAASPLLAAIRAPTPAQTRGPFYPFRLPLDSDNDLVQVAGRAGLADGTISHVTGRVLDTRGRPRAGVRVEIWQCDAHGRYHHPLDRRAPPPDPNFQGYGRFTTGADGAYRFRTIRPVPYPGRAPHIHFALTGPGIRPLVTQMYVAGVPENRRDGVLNRIPDARARARLIVPFVESPEPDAELWARFELVVVLEGNGA